MKRRYYIISLPLLTVNSVNIPMASLSSLLRFRTRKDPSTNYPGLSRNVSLYVIGDIHGRLDCLTKAHALIDRDRNENPAISTSEIYLGDYIDRGPDSFGVIDCLLARGSHTKTVFLRGNHETMFERFLDQEIGFEAWRTLGGAETLVSYGLDGRSFSADYRLAKDVAESLVPADHWAFLRALKTYHTVDPYCFVHAGLRPNVALARQTLDDLTGIRTKFLNHTGNFGFIVVHGHTPVAEVDFRPNRINIDTGAYATNRLSVLKITSAGVFLLDNVGRHEGA